MLAHYTIEVTLKADGRVEETRQVADWSVHDTVLARQEAYGWLQKVQKLGAGLFEVQGVDDV